MTAVPQKGTCLLLASSFLIFKVSDIFTKLFVSSLLITTRITTVSIKVWFCEVLATQLNSIIYEIQTIFPVHYFYFTSLFNL